MHHTYLITLPGPVGSHSPQAQVTVTATGDLSPLGNPVYSDASGAVRMEITPDGHASLLTAGPDGPLRADPLD
ncbi:DUF6296 family protein [Kitasatospora sp. NPDC048239]|uniref:DUF6296 family protein n=1 Tax=Kitasatospora sp. NPDC048239 TaxID=3364046 RepID=UPI00372438DB